MSRLRTISDKLDYIAMGKLNVEQMEYICEINQEVNLKDREIERLHSIIKEVREYIEDLAEDTGDFIGEIDRRRKVELLEILDKENI